MSAHTPARLARFAAPFVLLLAIVAVPGCTAIIAKAKGGYIDTRPPAPLYFGEWIGLVDAQGPHAPNPRYPLDPETRVVRLSFLRNGTVAVVGFPASAIAEASLNGPVGAFDRIEPTLAHEGHWRYNEKPDWPWRVDIGPWKGWLIESKSSWYAGMYLIDRNRNNSYRNVNLVPTAEFFTDRWLGFDFSNGRALELQLDGDGTATFWWYTIANASETEPTMSLDQHVTARWRFAPDALGLWVIDIGQPEPISILLNAGQAEVQGLGLRLSVPSRAFEVGASGFSMRLVRQGAKSSFGE